MHVAALIDTLWPKFRESATSVGFNRGPCSYNVQRCSLECNKTISGWLVTAFMMPVAARVQPKTEAVRAQLLQQSTLPV